MGISRGKHYAAYHSAHTLFCCQIVHFLIFTIKSAWEAELLCFLRGIYWQNQSLHKSWLMFWDIICELWYSDEISLVIWGFSYESYYIPLLAYQVNYVHLYRLWPAQMPSWGAGIQPALSLPSSVSWQCPEKTVLPGFTAALELSPLNSIGWQFDTFLFSNCLFSYT